MAVINKSTLFPPELEKKLFNAVRGHSSLARLSASEAVPFVGKDIFAFDFSNEIALVGESAAKPVGDGTIASVSMVPHKVVYTMRVSEEFMLASEEQQLDILSTFVEGFSRKMGRGLDIMAMHGLNPATGTVSSLLSGNYFEALVTSNVVDYSASTPDGNLNAAISAAEAGGARVTGAAISPTMRSAIAALTGTNGPKYPEFNWGAVPERLGAATLDVNSTVSAAASGAKAVHAIVGDFENAFRWGIAKEIPLEVIRYGDPDGQGDLKKLNQVALRAEAYIGWAIMKETDFALVKEPADPAPEQ